MPPAPPASARWRSWRCRRRGSRSQSAGATRPGRPPPRPAGRRGTRPPPGCPVSWGTCSAVSMRALCPKWCLNLALSILTSPAVTSSRQPPLPGEGQGLGDARLLAPQRLGRQLHRGAGDGKLPHPLPHAPALPSMPAPAPDPSPSAPLFFLHCSQIPPGAQVFCPISLPRVFPGKIITNGVLYWKKIDTQGRTTWTSNKRAGAPWPAGAGGSDGRGACGRKSGCIWC